MSEPLKKFQVLLRELFQFDSADLDFGLYRIMNHKRSVVERFIDRDLPLAVRKALERGALKDQSEQRTALETLARRIRKDFSDDAVSADGALASQHAGTNLGRDYLKLQAASGSTQVSESTEAEIYNRLYDFFSRYYEDGDFIALRRYGSAATTPSHTTAKKSSSTGPTRTSAASKPESIFATTASAPAMGRKPGPWSSNWSPPKRRPTTKRHQQSASSSST